MNLRPDFLPSKRMLRFFEGELDSYRDNVRWGNIDPSDGFHPTVQTALDSFEQAPLEYQLDYMGVYDGSKVAWWSPNSMEDITESIISFLTEFAWLLAENPDKKLVDYEGYL